MTRDRSSNPARSLGVRLRLVAGLVASLVAALAAPAARRRGHPHAARQREGPAVGASAFRREDRAVAQADDRADAPERAGSRRRFLQPRGIEVRHPVGEGRLRPVRRARPRGDGHAERHGLEDPGERDENGKRQLHVRRSPALRNHVRPRLDESPARPVDPGLHDRQPDVLERPRGQPHAAPSQELRRDGERAVRRSGEAHARFLVLRLRARRPVGDQSLRERLLGSRLCRREPARQAGSARSREGPQPNHEDQDRRRRPRPDRHRADRGHDRAAGAGHHHGRGSDRRRPGPAATPPERSVTARLEPADRAHGQADAANPFARASRRKWKPASSGRSRPGPR